jgi:hypothetical protein
MTTSTSSTADRDAVIAPRRGTRTAVVAAAGCAVLALRPALASLPHVTVILVFVYSALLVVGARIELPATATTTAKHGRAIALVVGALGFVAGRVIGGGHAAAPFTFVVVALNTLAACAEEAWFRRLCFGLFAPAGAPYAVVASAVLFALVHVAEYGPVVLPLDLAAGLLLGWQRAATGSWAVPAFTHALANVLVLR